MNTTAHARLEIRPRIENAAENWSNSGTEIADADAQFFGVYHVNAEGFSEHIVDRASREEAETVIQWIEDAISRKMKNPAAVHMKYREFAVDMVDIVITEPGKDDNALMLDSAATVRVLIDYITDTAQRRRIEAYEERKEEKRERYAELAAKHAAASAAAYNGVRRIMNAIPCGQPILVDHYSARRHRADISRMDRGMAASVQHRDTAAYYEDKAENYGNHGHISAADPAVLDKLRAELAELEKANEDAKAINRHYRKTGLLDGCPVAISDKLRAQIEKKLTFREKHGIGKRCAVLATNGAEIKRIRDRIAGLERNLERGHVEKEFSGGTYEEDPGENRANFYFPGKPDDATHAILKRNGFKWSPSRGAWTRLLNNAARCCARAVIAAIDETAAAV